MEPTPRETRGVPVPAPMSRLQSHIIALQRAHTLQARPSSTARPRAYDLNGEATHTSHSSERKLDESRNFGESVTRAVSARRYKSKSLTAIDVSLIESRGSNLMPSLHMKRKRSSSAMPSREKERRSVRCGHQPHRGASKSTSEEHYVVLDEASLDNDDDEVDVDDEVVRTDSDLSVTNLDQSRVSSIRSRRPPSPKPKRSTDANRGGEVGVADASAHGCDSLTYNEMLDDFARVVASPRSKPDDVTVAPTEIGRRERIKCHMRARTTSIAALSRRIRGFSTSERPSSPTSARASSANVQDGECLVLPSGSSFVDAPDSMSSLRSPRDSSQPSKSFVQNMKPTTHMRLVSLLGVFSFVFNMTPTRALVFTSRLFRAGSLQRPVSTRWIILTSNVAWFVNSMAKIIVLHLSA